MGEFGLIQPTGLNSIHASDNQKIERLSGTRVGDVHSKVQEHQAEPNRSAKSSSGVGVKNSPDQLKAEMKQLNAQLEAQKSYLRFEIDESTERMVFFIKNTETDEVLRQFPSEEFLAVSKNISDFLENSKQSSGRVSLPVGTLTSKVV